MKARSKKESQELLDYQALEEARLYEEHALTELRTAGYRITMPRVQVIRALADTRTALSAYAIHEKIISAGGKIGVFELGSTVIVLFSKEYAQNIPSSDRMIGKEVQLGTSYFAS